MQKAREVLAKTDIAVLVVDAGTGPSPQDQELLALFQERKLPHIAAYNKADLLSQRPNLPENSLYVSAKTGENVHQLKEKLGALRQDRQPESHCIGLAVSWRDGGAGDAH